MLNWNNQGALDTMGDDTHRLGDQRFGVARLEVQLHEGAWRAVTISYELQLSQTAQDCPRAVGASRDHWIIGQSYLYMGLAFHYNLNIQHVRRVH